MNQISGSVIEFCDQLGSEDEVDRFNVLLG